MLTVDKAIKEINLELDNLSIKDLKNLRDLIDSNIFWKEEEECKEKYINAIKNILKELHVIVDECGLGCKTAFTIGEDDYSNEYDIDMRWDDLKDYIEDWL